MVWVTKIWKKELKQIQALWFPGNNVKSYSPSDQIEEMSEANSGINFWFQIIFLEKFEMIGFKFV
jgi:hypothetical protein